MPRQKTKTSSFGTSKREGHDATQFYTSNLYAGLRLDEKQEIIDHSNLIPGSLFNEIRPLSLEFLKEIPDNSLHLIIFDPSGTMNHQLLEQSSNSHIEEIFEELYRALITGGRIAIIVDDWEKSEFSSNYYPLHVDIALNLIQKGFLMRGEIIWKNSELNSPSSGEIQQIGTYMPLNYKHILIFSKQIMRREKKSNEDTISRDQFLQFTKSIWWHQTDLMNKVHQQADNTINSEIFDPYNRILQLYSFESDKILAVFAEKDMDSITAGLEIRKNQIICTFND